jgi:hypothetical protein
MDQLILKFWGIEISAVGPVAIAAAVFLAVLYVATRKWLSN